MARDWVNTFDKHPYRCNLAAAAYLSPSWDLL